MTQHQGALGKYPEYEATIGIEVHVQLATASKIFCPCPNSQTTTPNSHICQICTGQPGVLPTLNKTVVDFGIMAALATNSHINKVNQFARKHYFYPDLPKNFQITQSDTPIGVDGHLPIQLSDGSTKKVRIMRIHMEEDAGKNIHSATSGESFVDFNRAGTPLLEIVTQPDIANAEEARAYLKTLRATVMYLGICSGNMEEGAFRADTNISVRKKGALKLGTRCELKNINSFKFIGDAIEYEIERQIELLESGELVRQETRLWDTKEHTTVMMRSKEEAADYRYLLEPDLQPVCIDEAWMSDIQAKLPELPWQHFERLCKQGLTPADAQILIDDQELAHYYETASRYTTSKQLINWMTRDLLGYLKEAKISLAECKVTPERLAQLVNLIAHGKINQRSAQVVFIEIATTGAEPESIMLAQGLQQVSNEGEIEKMILDVIANNQQQTTSYRSGDDKMKQKLWGFFVGQVMAKTQGKASPQVINELLKKHL